MSYILGLLETDAFLIGKKMKQVTREEPAGNFGGERLHVFDMRSACELDWA